MKGGRISNCCATLAQQALSGPVGNASEARDDRPIRHKLLPLCGSAEQKQKGEILVSVGGGAGPDWGLEGGWGIMRHKCFTKLPPIKSVLAPPYQDRLPLATHTHTHVFLCCWVFSSWWYPHRADKQKVQHQKKNWGCQTTPELKIPDKDVITPSAKEEILPKGKWLMALLLSLLHFSPGCFDWNSACQTKERSHPDQITHQSIRLAST